MDSELNARNYFISFQKLSITFHQFKKCSKYFIDLKLTEWTEEIISKAVAHLSEQIFDAEAGKYISIFFSHSIVEIVTLALQRNVDHHLKCLMLGRLIQQHPHLLQTCLIYFENAEAPWCTECSPSKKLKKKKTDIFRDLDIVECCWTFLQVSFVHFKTKWDWSSFINKYICSKDHQIVWIVCNCVSKLLCMNEKSRNNLLIKYFSKEEIQNYSLVFGQRKALSSALNIELPTLDVDFSNKEIFSDTSLSTSDFTVNICGVSLPVYNKEAQIKDGCLILVKSTIENLRKVAIGVSTSKAVCLFGPVGCGKSALIDHLAQLTGRANGKELLKVQLGEETDAKLLLGTYKCTDVPGEFIWESGVLTKAIMGGYWLLIEDIESATSDVAAVLSCLLEQNAICVPGFRDNVQTAPGFQLFMTHRLHPGLQSYHRKQTTATELLEKHWLQVNMEQLNKEELIKIIQIKFPVLKTIASRMVAVYLLFSKGLHEETDLKEQSLYRGGRLISTRDLLKWCTRAEIGFDVSSQESALKVLQDAIDIFCSSYSAPDVRLDLAGKVAACLGIIKSKAEYYCNLHKPYVVLSGESCLAGRVSLPKLVSDEPVTLEELSHNLKFALTRESCCLLERIAVCISLNEPTLLVGETGTGKTSTIQLLARQTGHNLIVINMNQQSDSSDLLGGYKPVDIKQLMLPLRDEFEKLFRSFFNVQENLKFLENISICISKRMWATLLKLMSHSQAAAVKRLLASGSKSEALVHWRNLGEKIYKLQSQINQGQSAMAFSFIEGSLVRALSKGHWVLLDEINLASAETLQCLSGLLEGSTSSVSLLERGDKVEVPRHPNFRLLAAMNPANDFGKKDLPLGIRNRFTEFFVSEYTEKNDLMLVVGCYLPSLPSEKVKVVVEFYLVMKKYAKEILSDSMGHKPIYSLRTLCRALSIASVNLCGNIQRSLYEALCLSFLTQLNSESHKIVKNMIAKTVLEGSISKSILNQTLPEPSPKGKYVSFEGYWVPKGQQEPYTPKKYLLTASVRRNLCDIARCVSLSNHPVLIQGETSVGKTSLITYLAQASGHKCFRINNHQHTDLQEYVGSYVADPVSGNLIFKEGVLVEAMRQGHWIILDELNLAPSEVLEALNRVLDDNRELYIPETQTMIKAHVNFRLFATQNPPGLYGGRKMLSRAFRNRFVELHFDEIPAAELEEILHHRCDMPMSYCKKMVAVMCDLQVRRKGSAAFAGKQGYITLRDLFRWGERYRLANPPESTSYYDWDQHIADEGYLVLAGRVRKDEESNTIKEVLEKKIKRTIDLEKLFTLNANTSSVTKHILEKVVAASLPTDFRHIVWTYNFRRLAVLVGKAIEFSEPILLIGDTGCGKTTICQLLTSLNSQIMYSVNCHQHSESSDFVGGLRPVRDKIEGSGRLFEWVDGPLVNAMKEGQIFLADEISLADDSVLERLNSLLEPERMLLISEKGSGDELEITAEKDFRFISTMNPGGDFGKKELSPALRNRLSEIWCEGPKSQTDLIQIIEHNVKSGLFFGNQQDGSSGIGIAIYNFVQWLKSTELGKRISVSIRDILAWVNFINFVLVDENSERVNFDVATAYVHGACLTFLDAIGTATTSVDNLDILKTYKKTAVEFLINQIDKAIGYHSADLDVLKDPSLSKLQLSVEEEKFGIHPFYISKVPTTQLVQDFMFEAPTTCLNTLRLLRALQISTRAVLLEGNPGVGKTSVVMALARATGNKVTRINLSEQTDVSDLFGADLPVEGAAGGTFAWRDGPFLKALKQGHWILLDELNLASQSVVEGLNSVLDHRGEIFIPELGKTFTLLQKATKIFACQNPQRQGGARKGLPQSFLNRFTQVFMEPLTSSDYKTILSGLHPQLSEDLIDKMIEFNMKLVEKSRSGWGIQGSPYEWNLRDLTYWIQTIEHNNPGTFVSTIYADRMRNRQDKIDVLNLYEDIFGKSYPLVKDTSPLVITSENVLFGEVSITRNFTENEPVALVNVVDRNSQLLVLRNQLPLLRSLALCVKMGWMAILVGDSYTGKTSTIQVLAQLVGQRLYSIPVSSAMDTTELLGAFEQTDYGRHLDTIAEKVEKLVNITGQKLILDGNLDDITPLLHAWHAYTVQHVGQDGKEEYTLTDAVNTFNRKVDMLNKVLSLIPSSDVREDLHKKLIQLKVFVEKHGLKAGGTFEWIDSVLVKCLQEGNWLVIDNVNLCSSAVLDRLNGLLESGGVLTLGERGVGPDGEVTIKPHKNFRIFLTMDPKHGSISRAMRNRGIEIFVEHASVSSVHPFDLEALLNKLGITLQSHRTCLIEVHKKIDSVSQGLEKPSLNHLLHAAFLTTENCRSGFPIKIAVENAFKDVYLKSRMLTKERKTLLTATLCETFKEYNKVLMNENLSPYDCFSPETKTLSTVLLQDNSQFSAVKQQSALILSVIELLEIILISNTWSRNLPAYQLNDIISSEAYQLYLPKSVCLEYQIIASIPFMVVSYYNLASYSDVILRHVWLEENLQILRKNNFTTKIAEQISKISDIVSTVLFHNLNKNDFPWDLRQINCEQLFAKNLDWSNENKLILLIFYKVILGCEANREEVGEQKIYWQSMTAWEYSRLLKKGTITEMYTDQPILCEISTFLEEIDKIIIELLTNKELFMTNEECCHWLYNVAWKFRLSNTANRRLFVVRKSATHHNIPQICEETLRLIILHYKWFRKYIFPEIRNLIAATGNECQSTSSFLQLVKKFDDSIEINKLNMIPTSRKIMRSLHQPPPHRTTKQCDISKVIHRLVHSIDAWKILPVKKMINNYLILTDKESRLRTILIDCSERFHLNNSNDEDLSTLEEMENTIRDKLCSADLPLENSTSRTKLWPFLELICLQLNNAVRVQLSSTSVQSKAMSHTISYSLIQWLEAADVISPAIVGAVKAHLKSDKTAIENSMLLVFTLLEQLNNSFTLVNPVALLKWHPKETTEDEVLIEGCFPLNSPLISLYLSTILKTSRLQDMSSLALKEHSSTTNCLKKLKLILWRNLTAIFSNELDNCLNEESCLRNSITLFLHTLIKHLLPVVDNNYEKLSLDQLIQEYIPNIIKALSSFSAVNELQNFGQSSAEQFQPPEVQFKPIVESLQELAELTLKLNVLSSEDKLISIGKAWLLLGHVYLMFFSKLELVDPIQKKAIKRQYTLEEIRELRTLICIESLNKSILGDSKQWPLKLQHETRIQDLTQKAEHLNKATAVRPCPSLYNNIHNDLKTFVTGIASNSVVRRYSARITSANPADIESIVRDGTSWIRSITGFKQSFYYSYYVTYPDIVTPVLLAVSQIIHGMKLVCSSASKIIRINECGEHLNVQDWMTQLSLYPIPSFQSVTNLINIYGSSEVIKLIEKSQEITKSGNINEYKTKLAKICVRLILILVEKNLLFNNVKGQLFNILDYIVKSWEIIQNEQQIKIAQEQSIYINKLTPIEIEEEETKRSISEIFPSQRDEDFGDLENMASLDYHPPQEKSPISKEIDKLTLSQFDIKDICKIHAQIVQGHAKAHWIYKKETINDIDDDNNNNKILFNERINIFIELIEGLYLTCDKRVDFEAVSALLLALNKTFDASDTGLDKKYDFYKDANISEAKQCHGLLNEILNKVDELLCEWPEHPTLKQIEIIIKRIINFSITSSISRFLTGLEILLTRLHEWEENAHDGVSLASHSASLTELIIKWRKLELTAWKGALNTALISAQENASKWWFFIYSLITSYLSGNTEEEELISVLENYMESSPLGEYSVRLSLLWTFHCHSLLLPKSSKQDQLCKIFWNLHSYYKIFKTSINKKIKDLGEPIEKKLKEFVKLARWNDINYWAVKAAIEKTHRTIHKFIKEYQRVLYEPSNCAMIKLDEIQDEKKLISKMNFMNYLTPYKLPELYADSDLMEHTSESLLTNLGMFLKKARRICKSSVLQCPYPDLLNMLLLLIEDIKETEILINNREIDQTLSEEKKRSTAKALLQRKRKAITDIFRTLTQLGISYRSGLLTYEQKNVKFTALQPINISNSLKQIDSRNGDQDWLICWNQTEAYFYTSVALSAQLKCVLQKPHQDLGPQTIEKVKGFSSHHTKLIQDMKESLCKNSVNLFRLRCLLAQLKNVFHHNSGIIHDQLHQQKETLKHCFDEIIFCVGQFKDLLNICPEQDMQEVELKSIPVIFPEIENDGLNNAFKYSSSWQKVKDIIVSILKQSNLQKENLKKFEKNEKFYKCTVKECPTQNYYTDIIKNKNYFECISNGYNLLKHLCAELVEIEQMFQSKVNNKVIYNPLTNSLNVLKLKLEQELTRYTQLQYPQEGNTDYHQQSQKQCKDKTVEDFENITEVILHKSLIIMQSIFKNYVQNTQSSTETHEESNVEATKETESTQTFSDNHIKDKIVENLLNDSKVLNLEEIAVDLENIFQKLGSIDHLETSFTCQRLLLSIFPHMDQLICLSQFIIIQQTSAVKVLSKLHTCLLSLFVNFSQNGYNIPEGLVDNEEGEGEGAKGGLGLGDGEGEKDISDQIESQDQLEDAKKPGEYEKEEHQECKEEEKGIEMDEDMGGKLQDLEKKGEGDEEDDDDKEDEPDKEMGETDKGDDVLDKEIWGSDSEEEPDEDEKKPEEAQGNRGAEETEKEMGAKDDDEQTCDEKENKDGERKPMRDEINEEETDNGEQIDPYHNKRPPTPEVEPLNLDDKELNLDDLNVDNEDEEEDNGENPFDIDDMKDQQQLEDTSENADAENEEKNESENEEEEPIDVSDGEDSTEVPQLKDKKEELEEQPDEDEGKKGEEELEKAETEDNKMEEDKSVPDSNPSTSHAESSEQKLAQDQIDC
ncbi:midasin isoform X4 [Rhodnius prolixus]|uniref:midasin isoform X4 n=1 Tax=Rhodnius prolixus TaxID=13249 RepID=UPI003D18E610